MKKNNLIMLVVFIVLIGISYSSTRRALLIGINEYKPENVEWRLKNLQGCVNDVNLMRETIKQQRFGFSDYNISILLNTDASRQNIINALEELASVSQKGDIIFFYYSGHGSQWKNTREPDGYDETMVPADAYGGAADIRDVELKKLLNNILAKDVTLTVIMDCCHSGSGTRGIIPMDAVYRYAEPIMQDIAADDNEPAPSDNPQALILAASHEEENAQEKKDPDLNNDMHGVFTSAIVKAINSSYFNEPSDKLFLRAKSILEGRGFAQVPDIEGQPDRKMKSLFGSEVKEYEGLTMVPVIDRLSSGKFELSGGLALGIKLNCQVVKRDSTKKITIRLRVNELKDVNRCIAEVIEGDASNLKSGDLVELDKKTIGGEPNIRVYFSPSNYSLKQLNEIAKGLKISRPVSEPTETDPDCIVNYNGNFWKMTDKTGKTKNYGLEILLLPEDKNVFVNYPPTASIYDGLKKSFEEDNSIELVSNPSDAAYILAGRYKNGKIEYAWMMQNANKVDEGNAMSGPIKTEWVEISSHENTAITKLNDLALKLGKVMGWLNLANNQPCDEGSFPYKLALKSKSTSEIMRSGVVYNQEKYEIVLVKDNDLISDWDKSVRYVYIFSIDKNGKMGLLYPDPSKGINKSTFPNNNDDETIYLSTIKITPPFGNDNYFLLTANTLIDNPASIFESEGVDTRGEKGINDDPLVNLLNDIGTKTRSAGRDVPSNWSIERITIRSAP